jgi:hypothetical protein
LADEILRGQEARPAATRAVQGTRHSRVLPRLRYDCVLGLHLIDTISMPLDDEYRYVFRRSVPLCAT